MDRTWIGLDVGTSSIKAVVFDSAGAAVADARAETPWIRTSLGTEMDPDELGRVALGVLREAVRIRHERPAGIGITSMGETGVLVDAHGRVVCPAIAWHDERDTNELADLESAFGRERFAEITGKPLRAQFALTKFAWQRRHVAGATRAARRFNVADWIAHLLTGVESCDLSLAGRTGWFDPLRARWSAELLEWSGATEDLMPDLIQPGAPIGIVGPDLEDLSGAVVTTAGHDHQAAMLGCGLSAVGDELDSLGTAEAIVRIVADTLPRSIMRDLALHAVTTDIGVQPGTLCLLGGTLGGLELRAALDALGVTTAQLGRLDDVALGLAPGRDEQERADAQRWRETVEAATVAAAELQRSIATAVGPRRRLMVAGGWRHSRTVLDSKRRHLGEFALATTAEAGARGAALLAARAAGALGERESWPMA